MLCSGFRYRDRNSSLCAQTSTFDGELAYSIVREEVGEGAFRSFDTTPIARR